MSHPQDLSDKSFRHLRSLCLAVLCERLAAFVLIATAVQMFSVRLGFPPSDSGRTSRLTKVLAWETRHDQVGRGR